MRTADRTPLAASLLRQIRKTPHEVDAGEFSRVIDRVHTATLTVSSFRGDGPAGMFSTWPAYRHTWWEHGAHFFSDAEITAALVTVPRFTPTPSQIDDCLPMLNLLQGISWYERALVVARASLEYRQSNGGWRALGAMFGTSHRAARQNHYNAMLLAYFRVLEVGGLWPEGCSKKARISA